MKKLILFVVFSLLFMLPCRALPIYDSTSSSFISKGEDLLIHGDYEASIENLIMGYELALTEPEENKNLNCMRSLFSLFIAYAHLENTNHMQETSNVMLAIMDNQQCNSYSYMTASENTSTCQPLNGPTVIPVEECINRVVGTRRAALVLAAAIPRKEVRALAALTIEDLADRAEACCRAGGLWKSCLIPLLNKWYAVQNSPIWFCY